MLDTAISTNICCAVTIIFRHLVVHYLEMSLEDTCGSTKWSLIIHSNHILYLNDISFWKCKQQRLRCDWMIVQVNPRLHCSHVIQFSTLSMAAIFLLNYHILFFSNIRSKSILVEINFIKEKSDLSQK